MDKTVNMEKEKKNRKILITGATGFVGQALCRQLLGQGYDVQILLRDPKAFSKIPLQLGAGYILGCLEDEASLEAACAGREQVIHLAGHAHVGKGLEQQAMDINLVGTSNLLIAAINTGASRIVYLSSTLAEAAATGKGDITAYGESKLQAEQLLESPANQDRISSLILRAVSVYGPGMKGNISRMISMIERGRLPPLPEVNNQISLISVEDLATAIRLAMDAPVSKQQTYTLSDGESYSIAELERAIYAALGKPFPRWRTPHMVLYGASVIAGLLSSITGRGGAISTRTYRNLTSDNLFSNEKAVSELGFKPSMTFFEELPKIVESIRETREN